MGKQLAKVLVLLVGVALIAACSTAAPTESPAPTATPELPTQPANVPTATVAPTATAPPPTEPPTVQPTATASPPSATPTPTLPPTAAQSPTPALPTATPSPTPALPTATPGVEEVIAALAGLSLDDFLEESYKQLVLRSPRKLTELGLSASYGQRNDRLDDLSDDYVRETQRLEVAVLDILRGFDRAALSSEQQVSYDVYEWYLDNRVRGQEFTYYDYPLNHFVNGYVFRLNELLTELHPLKNRQDAEDYVARLAQVDDQVEQLLEGLALREEIGVIAPDFILRMTKQDILRFLGTSDADPATIRAPMLSVYTVFSDALLEMDDLSAEERTELRESALEEIRNAFIPAFLDLLSAIDQQMAIATDEAGVWKLPNGGAYYAYALRQETSTDLTPEQVHEIGLAEVTRIQAEMRAVFDDLGYPQDRPVGELIQRAIGEGGVYDSSQVVAAYEAILVDIDQRVAEVFDVRPRASVVVVAEQGFGGYYTPGTADGSRPAAFHATVGGSGTNKAEMPTVAYHEAIPGHHFQVALTQEMALPTFRRYEFFNGHGEGWALYAERLASELGVYEDDPYGNIGRLRLELLRAARLVVDTGIHAKRWTREQARAYLEENVGGWTHEVERYVAWPAQATGYKIGMIKILELRQRAMDQLGDRFDIKEFHNVVLGNGILPLELLERLVNEYIESEQ
jgi:uncharacterized protein (DUF885 family)